MAAVAMNPNVPATLLPAAKASGRCPPNLLRDEAIIEGGAFEMAMLRALDRTAQGLILSSEPNATENFDSAMKMASGSSDARVLEQRRCLLLAAIGSTAEKMPSNTTLKTLLNAGLLVTIKAWLDDILASKVGAMDLLLHLLSNIIPLPVTKEMVTTSRLGKTVSSVEKNAICAGPNEAAIKSRIQQVKERWSASVKALKNNGNSSKKRSLKEDAAPAAKKAKSEGSSLSSLLKKVETTNNVAVSSTMSAAETARMKAQERDAKLKERLATANSKVGDTKGAIPKKKDGKKDARRIHWADSKGKALAVSQGDEVEKPKEAEPEKVRKSRWSERKKKEHQHEKELLLQSRNKAGPAASVDDDNDDMLNAMLMMGSNMWKPPQPLPDDKSNPPVQVTSNELAVQNSRMGTAQAVSYPTENEVPISPALLSEVEKALELTSRNTATPNAIPFFTPQAAAPAETAAMPGMAQPGMAHAYIPQAQPSAPSSEATLEMVLMMGLPMFLVGSNVQALQTLAANPGLLANYKDANGVYKQPELINLVQTLTQNIAPQVSQPTQMPAYAAPISAVPANQSYYQQPSAATAYAPPQMAQQSTAARAGGAGGYRGDQNVGDANLHLSGYGPCTNEEIKAMFAPYVHVTEVVNKSGFSFVNTSDPEGARRAREALNGSLLGGLPCRINPATRKARNPAVGGGMGGGAPTMATTSSLASGAAGLDSLPRNSMGQVDFDQVRDDRGNPATKNLFVAGYGVGTTEQQLKEFFGQYATVISVVVKGTFAFVNTTDRDAAVIARASLGGQQLNGGALRINFAKETGRLGTSFDSTYGPSSGSSYGRY